MTKTVGGLREPARAIFSHIQDGPMTNGIKALTPTTRRAVRRITLGGGTLNQGGAAAD
ncbi:MAG TPA: hypothetical protein VJV39_02335 [Dongiaceae bacterium]|nr:hypothetical protein [Dongiaceae bacterium]